MSERDWNKFIHPGLTSAQQIIVMGPDNGNMDLSPVEVVNRRWTDTEDRRVTDTGAPRAVE